MTLVSVSLQSWFILYHTNTLQCAFLNDPGSYVIQLNGLSYQHISDIMQHISCSKAFSDSICFSFISVYVFLGAYYALIDFARALKRLSNYKDYVVISVDENLQRKNYFLKCKSIWFCFLSIIGNKIEESSDLPAIVLIYVTHVVIMDRKA